MGLGPLVDVSLADARAMAAEHRQTLRGGGDPLNARRRRREEEREARAKQRTFKDCAEDYIESHSVKWKNAKHADQWRNTIATYAYPKLGSALVSSIDAEMIEAALKPIWNTKSETASRVRGRIESILDYATVKRYRVGDNPARWKGNLEELLPARTDVVQHLSALPYSDIHGFMQKLREVRGFAPRALEFTILTAMRTGAVIGARWDEIEKDVWTIPADRMKRKQRRGEDPQPHKVPLSKSALILLDDLPRLDGPWVFPGHKAGAHLSNMAMLTVIKRYMGRKDVTVHGFRSAFKDWASEHTNYEAIVSEVALGHTVDSKVERAYRRGELLEKRRRLMEEWAEYVNESPVGEVRKLRADG